MKNHDWRLQLPFTEPEDANSRNHSGNMSDVAAIIIRLCPLNAHFSKKFFPMSVGLFYLSAVVAVFACPLSANPVKAKFRKTRQYCPTSQSNLFHFSLLSHFALDWDGQPWLPARPNLPGLPAFLTAFHTDPLPRVRPLREQLPVQVDILRRVVGVLHLPHRGRVRVGHHQAPLRQDGRSRHRRGTPHERRCREINRV